MIYRGGGGWGEGGGFLVVLKLTNIVNISVASLNAADIQITLGVHVQVQTGPQIGPGVRIATLHDVTGVRKVSDDVVCSKMQFY